MLERKIVNLHLEKHLSILGLGVEKEIKILTMLIKARKAITNYAFQDACIALYSSKQDLLEWKQACKEQNYPEVKLKTEDYFKPKIDFFLKKKKVFTKTRRNKRFVHFNLEILFIWIF